MNRGLLALALAAMIAASVCAQAQTLQQGGWAALASDRNARAVGDSLTVLIYESASASNSTRSATRRKTAVAAQAAAERSRPQGGSLALSSNFDADGQSGRADSLAAQISVSVIEVLANGDLRVEGAQDLEVNRARTRIHVRGRVRPADISGANTVLSTRIAEAQIDYNGAGFINRASRPGLLPRLVDKLGLF